MLQQQFIEVHKQLVQLQEHHLEIMNQTIQCCNDNKQVLKKCSEIFNKLEQRENDILDIVDLMLQKIIQQI